MNKTLRLYLLSGNGSMKSWWEETLPHFEIKDPVPLELPGFGDNQSSEYKSLEQLVDALIKMTEPGHEIFAAGINGLVVLHVLVKRPQHFSKVWLMAPVGAFLWQRKFARWMALRPVHTLIHFLLARFPKLFRRKFSSQVWSNSQYRRMGEGYRKCKAFPWLFRFIRPDNALALFEWIETPVELIWGIKDAVLGVKQAAAWDSILPRADLGITLQEDWEHYPYIDDPEGFAQWMDEPRPGFRAHTKAGRLALASLAGLNVPRHFAVRSVEEISDLETKLSREKTYAVRSSGADEDKIDHSHAGINDSYLRVPAHEVREKTRLMIIGGMAEVAVQEFIEPEVSGVAFVRNLGAEVEFVPGHLETYISGKVSPLRASTYSLGTEWQSIPPLPESMVRTGFSLENLNVFLHNCIRAFHYAHSDIEWAWDGKQFHLLQLRPVTTYDWRRSLTSANLDEILPKEVSRIMEYAQRRAAGTIPNAYGRWDFRIFEDLEPFTVSWQGASYINNDLFLSRFKDWGMPSLLYSREIGGSVPEIPFRPFRFIRNIPMFLKMQTISRGSLDQVYFRLRIFLKEFQEIEKTNWVDEPQQQQAYADWFVRYYTFIVQQNMLINAAVSSSFGAWFRPPGTVYSQAEDSQRPHRVKFESDPASHRDSEDFLPIEPFPQWPPWVRVFNGVGMPGLRGYYIQVREWFRDNNMRIFHRLHYALKGSEWMYPWPSAREKSGAFWQDGGEAVSQDFSFMIYPGKVQGVAGRDILVVDALEPGHLEEYRRAKAVISKTGGRLSHGSTLLRELKKPSAVISNLDPEWIGQIIELDNGKVRLIS